MCNIDYYKTIQHRDIVREYVYHLCENIVHVDDDNYLLDKWKQERVIICHLIIYNIIDLATIIKLCIHTYHSL